MSAAAKPYFPRSDSLAARVILFFRAMGVPIYQIYGMTESAGVSHSQRPGATSLCPTIRSGVSCG